MGIDRLPTDGTLRYNGVEFTSVYRSKISGTPEYDEAGRTVKWVKWTLDVDGYIQAGTRLTTDTEMEDLRVALMTPGKALRVRTKGFGDLDVNGGGKARDANWGPKPEMLSWDPVGSNQAAVVAWRVTTCIPECDNPRYEALSAFNYETSWEIDSDGLTTRTITGYLEIAQTRQRGGSRKVPKSADEFRYLCRPAPLDGFERKQSFKLSKNKNRLDFTITDRQLPVALPEDATKCEMQYSVSSEPNKAFKMWTVRLSGSVTVPLDTQRSVAWDIILRVLAAKVASIRGRFDRGLIDIVDGVDGRKLIPTQMEVTEQVFGRSTSFSLAFRLMGSSLISILRDSGMWVAIPGQTRAKWTKSLLDSVYHERGSAGLEFVANEDSIVDLCLVDEQVPKPPPKKMEDGDVLSLVPRGRVGNANERRGEVTPEGTWLDYRNFLRLVTVNRTARHKRLPTGENLDLLATPPAAGSFDATRVDFLATSNAPAIPEPAVRGEGDVVQTTGTPAYVIEMQGYGLRLGHDIPAPRLVTVHGVPVTQCWADVQEGVVGAVGKVPIYATRWRIRYELPRAFRGAAPDLANPSLGLPGG